MGPLSYFDRIFVINLPSRADRRREIDRQLRRIGLSLESPQVELFAAIRPDRKGDFDSIGAHGCFMSHLGVLRLARDRRYGRIVILEDDVNFAPRFSEQIEGCVAALRAQPWDVFYGGYRLHQPIELTRPLSLLPSDQEALLAHFIALSDRAVTAATHFLSAMLTRRPNDPQGGPMHVDGAYGWMRRAHPDLISRLAVPQLGYQRRSRTDIHALRWFDRIPVVRTAVAATRAFSNVLTERTADAADAAEELG
jgi:hypothetical protein